MSERTMLVTRLISAVECYRTRTNQPVVNGKKVGMARMRTQTAVRKYMAMSSDEQLSIAFTLDGEDWVCAMHDDMADIFCVDLIDIACETYSDTVSY